MQKGNVQALRKLYFSIWSGIESNVALLAGQAMERMIEQEQFSVGAICNMDNTNHKALISVIMGIRYLRNDLMLLDRSIRSILDQTYQHFEFLICENGSTPAASRLLQQYAEQDCRIRLIAGSGLDRLAQKLNRCLKYSRGMWIARMDDDDYSSPERFERQIRWLSAHPNIAFTGCFVELEQDNSLIGVRKLPEFPKVKDFLFAQPFIHPALLFRREVLDVVGGYCEKTGCAGCEDYDLLLRLYEKGYAGANIQEPLFRYTLPPKGTCNRTMGMRVNEVRTRFARFQSLGLLPQYFPYVVKPIIVGLIPQPLLERIRARRQVHG